MKNLLSCISLFLILTLTSCEKVDDDTKKDCTSDCTSLKGKFITLNGAPISNIKVSLNYSISGGELGGGYTRKIVSTQSDENGNFNQNFYIKDNELGNSAPGSFEIIIDDSKIDANKYIRLNDVFGTSITFHDLNIYSITKRDTIIEKNFYIPKKAYIKIHLNNFIPQLKGDHFEVQTFYPFGEKRGNNTFLDSEYSTGFSGTENWVPKDLNTIFNVFVAEGEKNIIRIIKIKNGINLSQDYELTIPPNNSIELTYNF
ncbi:MAG: hypothetical protein V4497_01670 [Bacteroidota bacterium]